MMWSHVHHGVVITCFMIEGNVNCRRNLTATVKSPPGHNCISRPCYGQRSIICLQQPYVMVHITIWIFRIYPEPTSVLSKTGLSDHRQRAHPDEKNGQIFAKEDSCKIKRMQSENSKRVTFGEEETTIGVPQDSVEFE
ncbi:hypothetical protein J6590_059310 [Homalodisca vitripennis]|nr:hypothetical protein J6590_059310 [Homalodisca vitripennis]